MPPVMPSIPSRELISSTGRSDTTRLIAETFQRLPPTLPRLLGLAKVEVPLPPRPRVTPRAAITPTSAQAR